MKKKIFLLLSIFLIIAIFYFFYINKRNDSYKNVINLFDNVKDEKYLGYFFRYPNINIRDIENKIRLSIVINELYLENKKDEYKEEDVKNKYKTFFNDNKYKSESTLYKDKKVIYKDKKYYITSDDSNNKFKIYQKEIKKEYFFNKLSVYVKIAYLKISHDRYDIYKFYDNEYIASIDEIKEIENYEKYLKTYKFEFIMKDNKYKLERVGEVK